MKIQRLQITIEPKQGIYCVREVHVQVIADAMKFTNSYIVQDSDFHSLFDHLMEQARREVHRLIKEAE